LDILNGIAVKHQKIDVEPLPTNYKETKRFQKQNVLPWHPKQIKWILYQTLEANNINNKKDYDTTLLERQVGSGAIHYTEMILGGLFALTIGTLVIIFLAVVCLPVSLLCAIFSIFYSISKRNYYHMGLHITLLPIVLFCFVPVQIFLVTLNSFHYGLILGIFMSYSDIWDLFKGYMLGGYVFIFSAVCLSKSQKMTLFRDSFLIITWTLSIVLLIYCAIRFG